jgi:hypothetical protein
MGTITKILLFTLTALFVLAGCTKGPSPNLCPTVCDGLVAYYPFYGDATDKSGNGHDGKVIGATLTKDRNGYQNHAYLFNGRANMIELPNNNQITNIVQADYTISIWVKINDDTKKRLMDLVSTYSNNGHIGLEYHNRDSRISMDHWVKENGPPSNKIKSAITQPQYRRGEYHHIVGTVDSKTGAVLIYVDGDKKGDHFWNIGPAADQRLGFSWGIGKVHLNNSYAPLSGTVDEVRLYNRALSSTEVKELYLFTSAFPPAE